MSKGSRQRPVDRDKFSDNWDRIFGKKDAVNAHGVESDEQPDDWIRFHVLDEDHHHQGHYMTNAEDQSDE